MGITQLMAKCTVAIAVFGSLLVATTACSSTAADPIDAAQFIKENRACDLIPKDTLAAIGTTARGIPFARGTVATCQWAGKPFVSLFIDSSSSMDETASKKHPGKIDRGRVGGYPSVTASAIGPQDRISSKNLCEVFVGISKTAHLEVLTDQVETLEKSCEAAKKLAAAAVESMK